MNSSQCVSVTEDGRWLAADSQDSDILKEVNGEIIAWLDRADVVDYISIALAIVLWGYSK